ncbi:TolB family protein [Microbacterium sp. NPDC091313]
MSLRLRWAIVAIVSVLALGATAVVGVLAWQQYELRQSQPSAADTVVADASDPLVAAGRLVFRNTASGEGYGHVASVALGDPTGPRTLGDVACDRVDATASEFSCLRSERGIVPSYTATLYGADGAADAEWPLAGVPSRTRISADGALVASTSFVTGHSYATVGFSTSTSIRSAAGADVSGDFESWTLLIDGQAIAPVDRNYWGVTFIDDETFYATVGLTTSGETYLVRGDLRTRTFTALAQNVECPSLSPDGTRIAFKRVTSGAGATVHWTPAIYDIASGTVTLLPESRSVDDQIEWLDDDTILYGMPRNDTPGDSDVWRLDASGSGEPEIYLEHAWSPSVVRGDG